MIRAFKSYPLHQLSFIEGVDSILVDTPPKKGLYSGILSLTANEESSYWWSSARSQIAKFGQRSYMGYRRYYIGNDPMALSLDGKICLVTGATGGIGKPIAACLSKMGAKVVLLARDRKKGEAALDEILSTGGRKEPELMLCDLSDQQSVRNFARDFVDSHDHLNVLVNTAAVFTRKRVVTREGYELMFATNYLGPFLLTNLLVDSLKAGAPSRIITLSAPSTTKLNFADLQGEQHFRALQAFGASKTADLLFAYEMAARLEGTGITSNVLFPGVIRTNLMRNAPLFARLITMLIGKDLRKAAEWACYLSSSKEVDGKTGVFFKQGEFSQSSDYSRDKSVQKRLWEVSSKLTQLSS